MWEGGLVENVIWGEGSKIAQNSVICYLNVLWGDIYAMVSLSKIKGN